MTTTTKAKTKKKSSSPAPRASKLKTDQKIKKIGVWLTRSKRLELSWQVVLVPRKKPAKKAKPKSRRKVKKSRRFVLPPFIQQVVLPLAFLLSGLGGMWYFGSQIGKPVGSDLGQTKTFESPVIQLPTPKPEVPKSLSRSEPTHINIPAVGIDYPVISVGREADGSMQTPPALDKVTGWYKFSPTPGEIGPSVIVGHVDNLRGPSVFWRLREIKAGDVIEVARSDGKVAKFKVDALKEFDQHNFPTEEVYGNIEHAGLRLITCGGTFDVRTGHYNLNTVVFATIIPEPEPTPSG